MTKEVTKKVPTEPQYYFILTDGYRSWSKDFRSAICSALYEMTAQRQTSAVIIEESDGTYVSAGDDVPAIRTKVVFTMAMPIPDLFTGAGIQ